MECKNCLYWDSKTCICEYVETLDAKVIKKYLKKDKILISICGNSCIDAKLVTSEDFFCKNFKQKKI